MNSVKIRQLLLSHRRPIGVTLWVLSFVHPTVRLRAREYFQAHAHCRDSYSSSKHPSLEEKRARGVCLRCGTLRGCARREQICPLYVLSAVAILTEPRSIDRTGLLEIVRRELVPEGSCSLLLLREHLRVGCVFHRLFQIRGSGEL